MCQEVWPSTCLNHVGGIIKAGIVKGSPPELAALWFADLESFGFELCREFIEVGHLDRFGVIRWW